MPPLVPDAVTAHFDDIVAVYNNESQKPLKIAHRLTETVLRPKAIEKVNVKLALSVFHESTVNALIYFGYNNTASFVELFLKFWSIINVANSSIGRHKRDYVRDPIKSREDWKLDFLLNFAQFTALWESSQAVLGTASFFLSPQSANLQPKFNFLNPQPQVRICTF